MKILFCFIFIFSSPVWAQNKAYLIKDILSTMNAENFRFKERGKVFGYYSTQSCLYVSDHFAVLKNYCYPKKKYKAKSFTIISSKFGIIHFYQENISRSFVKQDIDLLAFSKSFTNKMPKNMNDLTIYGYNKIYKNLYESTAPGCWSTNLSHRTNGADVGCYKEDIKRFPQWANETQLIVNSENSWRETMDAIKAIIQKN